MKKDSIQNKVGMVMWDKINVMARVLLKQRGIFHDDAGLIQQEDITVLNSYASNNITSKNIKQKLTELKNK